MQTHTSTKHKSPIQYCMKQRRTMIHDDAIKAHSWDSWGFATTLGVGQAFRRTFHRATLPVNSYKTKQFRRGPLTVFSATCEKTKNRAEGHYEKWSIFIKGFLKRRGSHLALFWPKLFQRLCLRRIDGCGAHVHVGRLQNNLHWTRPPTASCNATTNSIASNRHSQSLK